MSVEELEQIRAYGAKLEAERIEAAKPPPPPPPVPTAQDCPVILVTDAGAFLNVVEIRKLLIGWNGEVGETLRQCGAEIHALEGGEFVRAEGLLAAFDCGIFGSNLRMRMRILQIKGPDDIEPRLPWGASRNSEEAFNAFTDKVIPEPLLEALAQPSRRIMFGGLPRGGDARGLSANRLEDMTPFELGVRTDLTSAARGAFLWIRFLPRQEQPAPIPAEQLSIKSEE